MSLFKPFDIKVLSVFVLALIAGYLVVLSLPEKLQPAALSACMRERIAYYALKQGDIGNNIAHFVYPKIERDTRAGRSIAYDYGSRLLFKDRDKEVIELFEMNVASCRKAYGDQDGATIWALLALAIPYRHSGQYEKSTACANEVLRNFEGKPLCEEVVVAYRQLRYNYSDIEDYKKAIAITERLVAMEEAFGENPLLVNQDRRMLAYCYRDAGQFDKETQMLKTVANIESGVNLKDKKVWKTKIPLGCKLSKDDSGLFDLND